MSRGAGPVGSRTVWGDPDQVDLVYLVRCVWAKKWIVILMTSVFSVSAVVYALLATEWYRAEALVAPVEQEQSLRLGAAGAGLAALAGISLNNQESAKPLEVLRSRAFIASFLKEGGRAGEVARLSGAAGKARSGGLASRPEEDLRKAVIYFRENKLRVTEEPRRGVVTVSVEWTDPDTASIWANRLIEGLNSHMREKASAEAETNISFLSKELASTGLITLQQSIGRLLENELQKLMMARGAEEYALRIIDPAEPPIYRTRPRRAVIVIAATLLGLMLSASSVLVADHLRKRPAPDRPGKSI